MSTKRKISIWEKRSSLLSIRAGVAECKVQQVFVRSLSSQYDSSLVSSYVSLSLVSAHCIAAPLCCSLSSRDVFQSGFMWRQQPSQQILQLRGQQLRRSLCPMCPGGGTHRLGYRHDCVDCDTDGWRGQSP